MSELTYNHKLALWRLSNTPGMLVERAGFNSRATILSLARRGYVRLEPAEGTEGVPYTPRAYLTEAGQGWIMEHPDKASVGHQRNHE
jgi:hypothetical protein